MTITSHEIKLREVGTARLQPKELVEQVTSLIGRGTAKRYSDEIRECEICGNRVDYSTLEHHGIEFSASLVHDLLWHDAWTKRVDQLAYRLISRENPVVSSGHQPSSPEEGPYNASGSEPEDAGLPDANEGQQEEAEDEGFNPWNAILSQDKPTKGPERTAPRDKMVSTDEKSSVHATSRKKAPRRMTPDLGSSPESSPDPWARAIKDASTRRSDQPPGQSNARSVPVPSVHRPLPPETASLARREAVEATTAQEASVGHNRRFDAPVEAQICRAYPQVSPGLARAIVSAAKHVGSDPRDLANIIAFESNLTFSPQIRNPRTGAVGLIQFDPTHTQRDLGISVEELLGMDAVTQMDWVTLKLDRARAGVPLSKPYQIGMAIFFPVAIQYPDSVPFPPEIVSANAGILSPRDYMARVGQIAKLEGSEPFPKREVPQTTPMVRTGHDAQENQSLLGSVLSMFQGIFGGEEASRVNSDPNQAKVVFDRDIALRFSGQDGSTWSEGMIPKGLYTVLHWSNHNWIQIGKIVLEPGKTYRVIRQDDQIQIL